MSDSRENLCRRCGRCCRVKLVVEDEVFVLPESCPYLDGDTKLCTVYERRRQVNRDCADMQTAMLARVFPADCPYVADRPDYRPPIEVNCEDDIWAYLEKNGK